MDIASIQSVIGKSVKSADGEDLGRIVDLLVVASGQVRGAVLDFGGVLGVGSRKVAIDWKAFDFSSVTKDGMVKLALTRNQVRVAPEYKAGDPVVILQPTKPEEVKPPQPAADTASTTNGTSPPK
jgi:hypothetical protein